MTKWSALTVATLAFVILLFLGLAACKQKVGERCQVTEDCDSGLVCNLGKDPPVCDDESSGMDIDALPPADAPPDTTPG